jgi:hypothetical protein
MTIPLLFGPYGSGALAHIDQLTHYGANAVWFHGFNPQAFEACAKHNIAACVEFKTFRADFDRHPDLIPIGVDGEPIRYGRLIQGVCLSKDRNASTQTFLAETEEKLQQGIRAYQPTGIWLDYLTYAGWFETPEPDLQESCFCPACITAFCEATDIDATTPDEILRHHAAAWTRHKCERIAAFAVRYAAIIHEVLPDCLIGAYMCPWTPEEFDGALRRIFAQDYPLLAPSIDVFTPLIYAQKSGREPTWGVEFLHQALNFVPSHRKVQLILDILDFPESLLAVATSTPPSWGIQLFGGAEVFSQPEKAEVFQQAVEEIKATVQESEDSSSPV